MVLPHTTFVRFSEVAKRPILVAVEEVVMKRYQAYNFDNRDSEQMYNYLEARIEALKRRITELEMENARLQCETEDSKYHLSSVCA